MAEGKGRGIWLEGQRVLVDFHGWKTMDRREAVGVFSEWSNENVRWLDSHLEHLDNTREYAGNRDMWE